MAGRAADPEVAFADRAIPRRVQNVYALSTSRHESAGRDVLGRHIGVVQRIEHRPQHVALEFQRLQHGLLLLGGLGVALDVVEGEIRVALCLRWTLGEIGQRFGADEVVVLEHPFDAFADDLRREQFGQGRCDRLEQGFLAHEMHVGFDREARAGQQPCERGDVVAVEAEPVGELEPARDAAVAGGLAVMIDEAAAPFPAQMRNRRSARSGSRPSPGSSPGSSSG